MKKRTLALLISSISSIFLSSCLNRRVNPIIPGYFVGTECFNEKLLCYLEVSLITKDEYDAANGHNVVEDLVGHNYYSLDFYTIDEDNNKTSYSFENLKDAYNGATGVQISYEDDNDTWITPLTELNGEVLPFEKCEYSVEYRDAKNNIEIYSYLYASKGE